MMQLYLILRDFLPDVQENVEIDVLEYSQQILRNTLDKNKPEIFLQALGKMACIDLYEIIKLDGYERLRLFVLCVVTNRLWMFKIYLRRLGYDISIR